MASGGKRRKSILLRLILLSLCVYCIVTLGKLQVDLVNDRKQLQQLNTEVSEQKLKNQELLRLLQSGTEKDFIERAARDRLGYVYADEEVYTDISGN